MRRLLVLLTPLLVAGDCEKTPRAVHYALKSGPATPVPEPSALLVFLVGLAILGLILRRWDKRRQ